MAYNVIIGVTNYTIQGGATQPSNDDAWQAQIDTAGAGTFEDINSIWAPDEPGIGAVQIPNCPAGTIRLLMNPVNEHTGGDLWLESAWTLDVPDGNGVWPGTFQNQDFSPNREFYLKRKQWNAAISRYRARYYRSIYGEVR